MTQFMNGSTLRLLDANANRAREALRVVEDYARFVLDDDALSGALKSIRHDLAGATKGVVADAILHRDTPGDVGTSIKSTGEMTRSNLDEVVTAAGKRLGEALRSVEEGLKTISPPDAASVEAIRYRWYDVEHRVAFTLRPAGCDFGNVRLYVLVTAALCARPWLEAAEEAILGGADCLQLREKDLEGGELLARARQLTDLCRRHKVLCVINDRPDIALLSGADGVHVGQGDLPAREVRKLIGHDKILGVSTHDLGQAKQAVLDGADYIGVGPFFRSPTKPRDFVAGPAYARQVAEQIRIPGVAIAGITADNVDQVLATGLRAVAVTAAVMGAADVRGAARALKTKLLPNPQRQKAFLPPSAPEMATTVGDPSSVGQTFLSVARAQPEVVIKKRHLPHWTLEGATYFVTFRVQQGELSPVERHIVLDHVRAGHKAFYVLIAAVVMPDHAHLILRPNPDVSLSRITKGTKGVSARRVNEHRNATGQVWQDESWDRIIRDQDELDEKLDYTLNNPVKAGLVSDGWAYDALFINEEVD